MSAANESYYIYKSQVFNIQKATVTIKPNDKTAYVGDEVPALGAEDYTVTGLVGNDTLTTAPKLSYASTPDMSTTGTYTIKASGAAANDDLYNLAYEEGTLTVSRRSSGRRWRFQLYQLFHQHPVQRGQWLHQGQPHPRLQGQHRDHHCEAQRGICSG